MKKKIGNIIIGLIFLAGLSLLLYPMVANKWNDYRQQRLISNYEQHIVHMNQEDFEEEWKKAEEFNQGFPENNVYGDVFGQKDEDLKNTEYWKVLNIANDGVMGYLSIPKIHIKHAIYHGTREAVLQTGIGHMNGSKLPIGGESTHSSLAAHRGLPSAKLFTDVDQLEIGDMFYIHVLDKVLAYKVDQILTMIDKNDREALENALRIEKGKDQVTLFTCTPYGVNSHRLLVRGTRVPYNGEEDETSSVSESMIQSIQDYYLLYLIMGMSITILIIAVMRALFYKKKK